MNEPGLQRFARLYAELDASTATLAKVAALRRYLAEALPEDAAWAVYFLAGGKPRQVVPTAVLRERACRDAGIEPWLFEACYQAVGDLAETIALVLPAPQSGSGLGLSDWMRERLLPLRGLPPAEQADRVSAYWRELDAPQRFLIVKLIGGGFRVGVSRLLVQRALAEHAGLDPKDVAQRMMGYTDAAGGPDAARYGALIAPGDAHRCEPGRPYPFFLAHAWTETAQPLDDALGAASRWLIEWKYDGIRAQVVRREGGTWIWTRGEELATDRFPEIVRDAAALPDGTVLDGEIVVWRPDDEHPAPFQLLQQRIGRKQLTRKVLAEAPVRFIAYDQLEEGGIDLRERPQHERRRRLEATVAATSLALSPVLEQEDWAAYARLRTESRARGVEGFMLKHREARYGSGRTKADGVWWKWKIEPLTIDGVLVYAQAGHGRRASVYTDYTFAVWNRPPADAAEADAVLEAIARREPPRPGALQLVPFAKAYSGLTDTEFAEVDRIIRASTVEKFGPVRSVRPRLVFELGFEAINRSTRHKSGIAVRFPRMLRIRHDKPVWEADHLGVLEALLAPGTPDAAPDASP